MEQVTKFLNVGAMYQVEWLTMVACGPGRLTTHDMTNVVQFLKDMISRSGTLGAFDASINPKYYSGVWAALVDSIATLGANCDAFSLM
eukprot:7677995-Pyramimonas_sp.AAC.1